MTTIVVPIFNAPRALERCLQALAATVPGGQDVLLIDDASDDPAVARILTSVPTGWRQSVNPENQGFVATANRGMELAGGGDVILLNADTVPAGRWLERMEACAASDPSIASITPFTNNGEIASIPHFCQNNPLPDDPGAWARACLEAGAGTYPVLPTAVGFCMYLRRRCLEEIGGFDEARFGRGYGEENDWSMRAANAGWKNVLCDDAFVAHEGGASFGPLGLRPDPDTMGRLLEIHPDYMARVSRFIEDDPLRSRREAIMDRLENSGTPEPARG